MRISDWSSDVCSSDLLPQDRAQLRAADGDGGKVHHRPGVGSGGVGRTRSRGHRDARHFRAARGGCRRQPMSRVNPEQMAERVARDIPEGAYGNLGIGLPTSTANSLPTTSYETRDGKERVSTVKTR